MDYLRINDRQLFGPIDYMAWRRQAKAVSSLKAEVADVHAIEANCTGTRPLDDSSVLLAMMGDARDSIATLASDVIREGVSTAESALWMGLADAISCASRLVVVPDLDCGGGATVRDFVLAVALLFDTCARAADPGLSREALPPRDRRRQQARIAQVYVDIMVGRTSPWVTYCHVMGAVAALAAGRDYAADSDVYAMVRCGNLEQAAARTGVANPHGELMLALMGLVALRDGDQTRVFARDPRRPFDVVGAMRPRIVTIAGPAIKAELDRLGNVDPRVRRGYQTLFGISPMQLVMSSCSQYEGGLEDGYAAVLAEEGKAR